MGYHIKRKKAPLLSRQQNPQLKQQRLDFMVYSHVGCTMISRSASQRMNEEGSLEKDL